MQDAARDVVPPDPTRTEPGWDQVAAFVVSYEESGAGRRVVVTQAEHTAPEPVTVLDGWLLNSDATAWMLDQVTATGRAVRDDSSGRRHLGPTPR